MGLFCQHSRALVARVVVHDRICMFLLSRFSASRFTTHSHAHTHTHTHIHTQPVCNTRTHTCVFVRVYAHTHTHTHTHRRPLLAGSNLGGSFPFPILPPFSPCLPDAEIVDVCVYVLLWHLREGSQTLKRCYYVSMYTCI